MFDLEPDEGQDQLDGRWVVEMRGDVGGVGGPDASSIKCMSTRDDLYTTSASVAATTDTVLDVIALQEGQQRMIVDATNAYVHAEEKQVVYCKSPPEWFDYEETQGRSHDRYMLFRHRKKLYGRQDASQAFNDYLNSVLDWLEFERSVSLPNPCTLR